MRNQESTITKQAVKSSTQDNRRVDFDRFHTMTPAQKLNVANQIFNTARVLKKAYYRDKHLEWSDDQVEKAVRDWILYANS